MNECVYASDIDTDELVYMNKKALRLYGIHSLDEVSGKKCYEVLQHCAAPCAAEVEEIMKVMTEPLPVKLSPLAQN